MRTRAFQPRSGHLKTIFGPWPGLLAAALLLPLFSARLQATDSVVSLGGGDISAPFYGDVDGNTWTTAKFNTPTGLALDPSGTYLFVADYNNNAIRLVSQVGNHADSMTTTFVSSNYVNGVGGVNHPLAVAVDSATNVYVLNHGNGTNGAILHFSGVRMNSGLVVGGYPLLASNLVNATAMAMDGYNNLYVTVNSNKVIRVTPNQVVTTLGTIATNGVSLQGIAVLDDGQLALTDAGNNGIWILNPANGTSIRFTGFNGQGDTNGYPAAFFSPEGISKAGNGMLVVADYGNDKVKLVDPTGVVTLLYGVSSNLWVMSGNGVYPGYYDGPGTPTQGSAEARLPFGVLVGPDGSVYTTEDYYHVLRHVVNTGLAAPEPGYPPVFHQPDGLAYDGIDNLLFMADVTGNAVQALDLNNNITTQILNSSEGLTNPVAVLVDTNDNLYVLNQGISGGGYILEFDNYGNAYGPVITGLNQPTAFTMDGYGDILVAEQAGNIWAFGTESKLIATITNANVSLQGIALFDDGSLAVSDAGNNVIWSVDPIKQLISRLTGQLGLSGITVGASNFAKLNQPLQLARASGNQIVAADSGNNRLVLVQRNGSVSTNALNSLNASVWFGNDNDPVATNNVNFVPMASPAGVAVGAGGEIFASETRYDDIRGLNTTIAGPASNPGVPVPVYGSVAGIALNNESTELFVTDPTNNTIRVLDLANNLTTVFLDASNGIDQPVDVAVDSDDNLYVLNQGTGNNGSILEFDAYGDLMATNATSLEMPTAMKRDFFGNIYVTELGGLVQEFSGSISNTLANITTNNNVQLEGVALLDNGSLIVSDAGNSVLWQIATNGTAVVFTGVLGTPGANLGTVGFAKLNHPSRLADALNGILLIADSGNNRVVQADDLGTISTVLVSTNGTLWFGLPGDPIAPGSGNYVPMVSPVGLAIASGNGTNGTIFASESVYNDIRSMVGPGILPLIAPPPAPLNLVARVTYGQITLTWSPANGANFYYVEHSPSSGGPYTIISTNTTDSYTDYELGHSTNYYVVVAVNAGGSSSNSLEVLGVPLVPPPPAPVIGWYDYEGNAATGFFSVLHAVSVSTFNNVPLLAINPETNGVSTYYTTDGSNPAATNGSTPPFYQDGIEYDNLTPLPAYSQSNLVIKAINIDSYGQASPITTAQFIFQVGSPTIFGNNGAQFQVSDITPSAELYYTTDGSTPSNGPPSIGPVILNSTNYTTLSLVLTSNVVFKVRGYLNGYFPSGVAQQAFSVSNFVANTISFGFASGEASSAFIAAPGQTFYAPVTLTTLPGVQMYSLQYNIVVTNAGPNPGPGVASGAFNFQTMLMKPDPDIPNQYIPIYPYMFAGYDTGPVDPSQLVTYEGTNFINLLTIDPAINLLGVGWLERYSETNLYITTAQDLIQYSLAHDDLFLQANNKIILGGYSFTVPGNAQTNQTYQLQISRPSATSDGVGAPGSSVYIAASTNGPTGSGGLNALKFVTVGQIRYLVGSVYPFGWFNAGDFGSGNLVNADVEQVFEAAVYQLDAPPAGSDFFDAMDSCGGNYVDLGNGYLQFGSYISGPGATYPLFDGNDTSINQIAFGDGQLDVCDVYVTYRRSLDPSLAWFQRYWQNGQRVAQIVPNVASAGANSAATHAAAKPKGQTASTAPTNNTAQVNFTAVDVSGAAGQTVQVPIDATVLGNYPLRVLMLNLTVTPLDGSPALTTPIRFTQTATVLGAPVTTDAQGNGNYSAVWLNSTNTGLTGTSTIGYLTITIPATATTNAAYAIHFDHASASPNGLAAFPKQTLTGLITLSSRTNSYYHDGIPDSWRLRWFGTIYNALSESNACPSGDGINNWQKFVAGVDPNQPNDFPSTHVKTPPTGATTAIHWPSVSGVQYVILRSPSLFNGSWTAIATNTGTGGDMEFDDTSTGKVLFYRVLILPPTLP